MPRILIAGCGYVGQAAADLFHAAGWAVEGWTRSARSAATLATKPYLVREVDISERAQVAKCLGTFDAIIHCVSSRGGDAEMYRQIYLDGARNLLESFLGSKLLFTSSTSVYAQRDGSWVTEESKTKPMRETSRILLEVESLVLTGAESSRGSLESTDSRRSALLDKFLSGAAIIDSENDRFVNQVHRDDVAAALFHLVNQKATGAQIYNVVDDQPILQSECYRWLAHKLNRPLPPIATSKQQRKRGDSNKRVSNAKLRRLGWTPRYPTFADAMEKSILPSVAEVIRDLSC